MLSKKESYGFTTVGMVVAVIVVAAIILTGIFVWNFRNDKPDTKSKSTSQQSTKKQTTNKTSDAYAGWKDYSNQTYGITFKYPSNWAIEEIPVADNSGVDPIELAVNLKLDINEKYNGTAELKVHKNSMSNVASFYDDYFHTPTNQVSKQSVNLKGKQAIAYDVTAGSQRIKLYLFSVNEKTYSFGSLDEELNAQRSSDYWTNFDKVFESLSIQ